MEAKTNHQFPKILQSEKAKEPALCKKLLCARVHGLVEAKHMDKYLLDQALWLEKTLPAEMKPPIRI